MAGLDGLGLDMLGGQQLIFEGSDVRDALLLEGLQASIEGFLEGGVRRQAPHGGERDNCALSSALAGMAASSPHLPLTLGQTWPLFCLCGHLWPQTTSPVAAPPHPRF